MLPKFDLLFCWPLSEKIRSFTLRIFIRHWFINLMWHFIVVGIRRNYAIYSEMKKYMFSRWHLFLFFNTGLTPAKFPKSLTDNIGGFNSGSASSLSIARQGIDSSTHRPNTPSQSHSSSPFLPGCYQRKALSPRIQSPIMRNSSYLGQSKCGNDMQQHIMRDWNITGLNVCNTLITLLIVL